MRTLEISSTKVALGKDAALDRAEDGPGKHAAVQVAAHQGRRPQILVRSGCIDHGALDKLGPVKRPRRQIHLEKTPDLPHDLLGRNAPNGVRAQRRPVLPAPRPLEGQRVEHRLADDKPAGAGCDLERVEFARHHDGLNEHAGLVGLEAKPCSRTLGPLGLVQGTIPDLDPVEDALDEHRLVELAPLEDDIVENTAVKDDPPQIVALGLEVGPCGVHHRDPCVAVSPLRVLERDAHRETPDGSPRRTMQSVPEPIARRTPGAGRIGADHPQRPERALGKRTHPVRISGHRKADRKPSLAHSRKDLRARTDVNMRTVGIGHPLEALKGTVDLRCIQIEPDRHSPAKHRVDMNTSPGRTIAGDREQVDKARQDAIIDREIRDVLGRGHGALREIKHLDPSGLALRGPDPSLVPEPARAPYVHGARGIRERTRNTLVSHDPSLKQRQRLAGGRLEHTRLVRHLARKHRIPAQHREFQTRRTGEGIVRLAAFEPLPGVPGESGGPRNPRHPRKQEIGQILPFDERVCKIDEPLRSLDPGERGARECYHAGER